MSGAADSEKQHLEAQSKFDYFVTGGAGAALSYALQAYRVETTIATPFFTCGLLLLFVSLGVGLFHLRSNVRRLSARVDHAQLEEHVLSLRRAHTEGMQAFVPALNTAVGGEALSALADKLQERLTEQRQASRRRAGLVTVLAVCRDVALLCGFFLFAVWRLANL
jgi:hypothetical protein